MKEIRIAGLELQCFVIVVGIIVAGCALGAFPTGMVGAFLFLMVFGDLLNVLGNVTPVIKTFLGGGAIVSIFGGAAVVYWKLIPEPVVANCATFMKGSGFLDFYIAALITGSILGMERKLLIRAALRYLPCIMGAVGLALIGVALFGKFFSMSAGESIAYIGIPIMGGGMGAGAVPISKVFENALNIPSETILSRLVPAVALGNAFAIVCGGLLNRVGEAFPVLTGNGRLVISDDDLLKEEKPAASENGLEDYATGLIVSAVFFALGNVIAAAVKKAGVDIHPYAWMILSVAAVKCLDVIPRKYEENAQLW